MALNIFTEIVNLVFSNSSDGWFWVHFLGSCLFIIVVTEVVLSHIHGNGSQWPETFIVVGFQLLAVAVIFYIAPEPDESCGNDWIASDNNTGLHYAFRGRLFGQDKVQFQLEDIMHSFFKDKDPHRPLVLSFHGTTGTGKNHVSRLIAESIYKKGMESRYVHLKIPTKHYPLQSDLNAYKESLQKEIQSSVSQCPRQLFIFDEVENFPAGLIDVIKPYIDYHDKVEGVDYRQSIFIFLSNIGGREITNILMEHDSTRKSLRINDFEKVLATVAYNTKGGFRHSRLMDSHLIGHYIPFLPLEREHVELCIEEEMIKMGLPPLSEDTVPKVIAELQFRPEDTQRFAMKGCKNIREKLNLYAYKRQYARNPDRSTTDNKKETKKTKRNDEL